MTEPAPAPAPVVLPDDRLYAPEQDMWVQLGGDGSARIGAVHLVAQHGRFMLFTPRQAGTLVERDRSLGVMETAKTAVAIHAPLSCRIDAANAAVERDAALVAADPYGAGWLFVVTPTALDAERGALLDAGAYRAWLSTRMGRFAPPAETAPDLFNPQFW
jgi:glycine cleavage system H protein